MNRLVKGMWPLNILVAVALVGSLAFARSATAQGASGATLQADKTIDICEVAPATDTTPALWHYSGAVAVWNTGAANATGCVINDLIETKNISGPNWTLKCTALTNAPCGDLGAIVPGGTLEDAAFVTTYSCDGPAATTTVRNNAQVKIDNHSGGKTNGPNPKATYSGLVPPPACGGPCGCSLTQGYWKTHSEAWPATADLHVFDSSDLDSSGVSEALAILNANGGNTPAFGPWYIVAKQYIAYLLNVASGACTPSGLQPLVQSMGNFFTNNPDPVACAPITGSQGNRNPCNANLADACILDQYNHGEYLEGPTHCGGVTDDEPKFCGTP